MTVRSGNSAWGPGIGSTRQPVLVTLLFGETGNFLNQFARYLVVGGLAFIVDFGSLYLLTEFAGLHYLASAAVAFLLGLITNYLLSRVWVFDRRTMENTALEFLVFAVIGIVGLGLNEAIIWFVREKIHFHYMVAKVISSAIVLMWNFGARRSLLFSERPMPGFLMKPRPPFRTWCLSSAYMAAACLTLCLGIQGFSGAWHADFVTYPDEPSHFVGAVMVRDWLVSDQWFAPLQFARNYYAHYPFFAVGYWPPLFSLVTGLWLLVAGVGRPQALLIPAVFAAGTGWLIFRFVRQRAGLLLGVCAGALYLSLPAVRLWMCAVMVDHMTTFLCVAAAVCLLRYLRQPLLWNGILCALVCGCGILSKYSAAYTAALPFLAVLLLRRFELLRKPSFLAQPFVIALMVGPWAVWTRRLAYYGLPSEREALTAKRAASFVLGTFEVFPPVLMAVVILGVIAALVRLRAWRDGLVVVGLLCAGHLAFMILSPVRAEERYLLVPAAALLMVSFVGWSEVLALIPHGGRWSKAVPAFVAILTAVLVFAQFDYSARRMPQDHIRDVVAFIVNDPARAAQRVVVPPSLEGPVIAEFVAQSRHRPDRYLLRPSKILARSDWFGGKYSSVFGTPEEMLEYFRQHPVSLVIWTERPEAALKPHASTMSQMLRRYPLSWQPVLVIGPAGGAPLSWTVYENRMPPPGKR